MNEAAGQREQLAVYGELIAQRRWRGMVLRRLVRAESG
jgi:hypothetical protein